MPLLNQRELAMQVKGFALVAVEVRRLAQSAAPTSNRVKLLIEATAGEVKSGSPLVGQATDTLKTIPAGAQESSAPTNQIGRANREQSAALMK